MFFLGELPEPVLPLLDRLQTLSVKLMADFNGPSDLLTLNADSYAYGQMPDDCIGRIKEGVLCASTEGEDIFCYENGDLFGIQRIFDLPHCELRAQDDTVIELIQRDVFTQYLYTDAVRQHRWSHYLLAAQSFYQQLLSNVQVRHQLRTPTGFEHLIDGDVIVKEGELADTVFQLMSGSANVDVGGTQVGEVLEGEIFGAMAVFTGERRNATVTAREDCTLLAIPQDQFIDLIRAQPDTAMTLLDNMSRRIKALNQQVIDKQS